MRAATDIVDTLVRDVCQATVTLDTLERRVNEFGLLAVRSPEGTLEKAVSHAVAVQLRRLHDGLAVSRFKL